MTDRNCDSIAEMLVPYADTELSESDTRLVAAHLDECADCRGELDLLRRSLELAESVWEEAVRRESTSQPVAHVSRGRKFRARQPFRLTLRPTFRPSLATVRLTAMILVLAVTTNLLVAGGLGYGEVEPYDLIAVTGRVTFDDGTLIPVGRITVVFISQAEPIDPKTHPRPGHAEVDVTDGTFSRATTHRFNDGLITGRHLVQAYSYNGDGKEVSLAIVPSEIEVGDDATRLDFVVRK